MMFENLFKKNKIVMKDFIRELINSYSLVVDSQMILEITIGKLNEVFQDIQIHFFQKQDDDFIYNDYIIKTDSKLFHWLLQNQTALKLSGAITEYIKMDIQMISDLEPQLIFPIMLHNKIILIASISNCKTCDANIDFFNTIFQLMALAWESTEKVNKQIKQLDNDYQQKKMAMIGRMASSVAHEIRNPLTSIRSSIQFLSSLVSEIDGKNIANNILSEVDRINEITRDLLNFSKPRQVIIGIVNLNSLINYIFELYKQKCSENGIKIELDLPNEGELLIKGDEDNLKQVLINFMQNSLEAMEYSKEKKITIEVNKRSDNTGTLKWIDTGSGMPADIVEHIMEPFYTTKKNGTGLGLSIVKQILEQHGYILNIKSKIGTGTIMSFNLDFAEEFKKW